MDPNEASGAAGSSDLIAWSPSPGDGKMVKHEPTTLERIRKSAGSLYDTYGDDLIEFIQDVAPGGRLVRLGISGAKRLLKSVFPKGKEIPKDAYRVLPVDSEGQPYVPADPSVETKKWLATNGIDYERMGATVSEIEMMRFAESLMATVRSVGFVDKSGTLRQMTDPQAFALINALAVLMRSGDVYHQAVKNHVLRRFAGGSR